MAPRQETLSQYTERLALRLSVPAGILLAIAIIVANWQRNPVPLVGDWLASGRLFAIAMIPMSLFTGGASYVLGTRAWNERVAPHRQRAWRWGLIPIILLYALLLTGIATAGVLIISLAFRQLVMDKYQSAMLAGTTAAALLFWMSKEVIGITVIKLLQTTVIVVAASIYLSMATVDDPLWWQTSFSHLGTLESNTYMIFNATLIFAGILFLVWVPYLMSDLHILSRHHLLPPGSEHLLRRGFALLSFSIMLVGIFIYGITPITSLIHNTAAYCVAGVLLLMMVGLYWLVPALPREFFATSWIMVVVILAAVGAGAFGYFNTVGIELVSAVVGMAWLQSFVRNVEARAIEVEPEAFPARL